MENIFGIMSMCTIPNMLNLILCIFIIYRLKYFKLYETIQNFEKTFLIKLFNHIMPNISKIILIMNNILL